MNTLTQVQRITDCDGDSMEVFRDDNAVIVDLNEQRITLDKNTTVLLSSILFALSREMMA